LRAIIAPSAPTESCVKSGNAVPPGSNRAGGGYTRSAPEAETRAARGGLARRPVLARRWRRKYHGRIAIL